MEKVVGVVPLRTIFQSRDSGDSATVIDTFGVACAENGKVRSRPPRVRCNISSPLAGTNKVTQIMLASFVWFCLKSCSSSQNDIVRNRKANQRRWGGGHA